MHCMNTDLSDQALTLTVPVNQVSVARAPIDLVSCGALRGGGTGFLNHRRSAQ
jgi:hypothetical protein